MLSARSFHRLFRLSAWYDVLVTFPYATPFTLAAMWWVLGQAHAVFGLPPLPALSAYSVLFANFFGTVVLLWATLRLRQDDARLARYDAVARWLFSAWMVWALVQGSSPLLWLFLAVELSFAVVQSLPVKRA